MRYTVYQNINHSHYSLKNSKPNYMKLILELHTYVGVACATKRLATSWWPITAQMPAKIHWPRLLFIWLGFVLKGPAWYWNLKSSAVLILRFLNIRKAYFFLINKYDFSGSYATEDTQYTCILSCSTCQPATSPFSILNAKLERFIRSRN